MAFHNPKPDSFLLKNKTLIFLLLLSLITFGVYSRITTFEFINFDDGIYVWGNTTVKKGFSSESLSYAFDVSADNKAYWHPLTWLSHMLDCQLFGLNAGWHHSVSLTFHTLNSLLLFYVFFTMTGSFIQSAIIATLFALHPLSVDSVVWISERKNVLSTFFWMLSMLAYVAYARKPGAFNYLIVLTIFILGLLAKPLLVTLPCVFILMDLWPLRRVRLITAMGGRYKYPRASALRIIIEKVPFFLFSFLTVFLSSYSLKAQNALWATVHISMVRRIENALVTYLKYIYKIVWPNDLAIYYPFPDSIPFWKVVGAACLLLTVSFLVIRQLKPRPWLALGWFWYLGTLFPFIGLVQGGLWPEMADRWAYVPQIGLFIMVAWPISNFFNITGLKSRLAVLIVGIALMSLAAATWIQSGHWKNSKTLFNHSLSITGDNYPMLRNLGQAIFYKKDYDGAIEHYRRAIQSNPSMSEGHVLLADALKIKKKIEEAIRHYKTAIELGPANPQAYTKLGILLQEESNPKEALKYLKKALTIDPENVAGRHSLGLCLAETGDFQAGEKEVLKALKMAEDRGAGLYNAGAFYGKHKKPEKAKYYLEKAIEMDPGHPEANYNLGIIALGHSKTREAEHHFQETLTKDPKHIDALNNLGLLYSKTGRPRKAIKQFNKALAIDSQDTLVLFNLANAWLMANQASEAIDQFSKIMEIDPDNEGARIGLLEVQRRLDRIDSEIALTDIMLKVDPEDPTLLVTMGDLYIDRGAPRKALGYYKKLHKRLPEHPGVLSKSAATYAQLADYENAVALFKDIVSLVPEKPEGYYNVACIYSRLNKTDQALKWLRQAIDRGYKKFDRLEYDEDLENVRNSRGFKDLIGEH